MNFTPTVLPTVLIVEDQDDVRSALRLILEQQHQYQLIGAQDGREALTRATHTGPDLILMDIGLPGLNGLEATRQLKANPQTQHIPIIAVSVYCAYEQYQQEAMEAGCIACISKPFEPDLLVKTVEEVLSGSHSGPASTPPDPAGTESSHPDPMS